MKLNKSGGDMYPDTFTCNPLAGRCPHECTYCYVPDVTKINRSLGEKYDGEHRLNEDTLLGNTGSGKTIFVCSMNDMFAEMSAGKIDIINKILKACRDYPDNTYLFQTKNPGNLFANYVAFKFPPNTVIGTTIETDDSYLSRKYSKAPRVDERASIMRLIKKWVYGETDRGENIRVKTMVSIEPIMSFYLEHLVELIETAGPDYVSIGADTSKSELPEPDAGQIFDLIIELQRFTEVRLKPNLRRLIA